MPRRDSPTRVPDEQKLVPPAASIPPPLPPPLPPAPPPATPFNWEAFMGVKLFAWLGGLALFLGVVFTGQILLREQPDHATRADRDRRNSRSGFGRHGLVAGARPLPGHGPESLRHRHRHPLRRSFCRAFLLRAHFPNDGVFRHVGGHALFVPPRGKSSARRLSSFSGLLGGFLTPVLLRSGVDNAPALFLYIALLDLGLAAVALRKHWHYLVLLAAVGTA